MATVLLVMKRSGNVRVLTGALAALGHRVVAASNDAALDSMLSQNDKPSVALVDVSGFVPADWRLCGVLQRHQVRFVVLCPEGGVHRGSEALRYGATSLLQKPIQKDILLQIVQDLAGETVNVASYEGW